MEQTITLEPISIDVDYLPNEFNTNNIIAVKSSSDIRKAIGRLFTKEYIAIRNNNGETRFYRCHGELGKQMTTVRVYHDKGVFLEPVL